MKLYAENLCEGEKSTHFQNIRAHNLETCGGFRKKNAAMLETS